MPQYFRSDTARVHLSATGVSLDSVSWDKMEGGDNTAETTNFMPGGMEPSVELGGPPKRSDLTLTRIWSDTLLNVFKKLDAGTGNMAATATYQVLDANKQPVSNGSITYTGIIKSVARPNYDSSTSTEASLVIIMGLNESLT